MLQKKIDMGYEFIAEHRMLFRCPKCHEAITETRPYSMICANGHQYDLSKKGTLYFLSHQIATEYNKEMLLHRRQMIADGLYGPLFDRLAPYMPAGAGAVCIDMGCGEGSFLKKLVRPDHIAVGFDISKDGIFLATDFSEQAFWCVADITNMPFQDASADVLLNILSPSHYSEMARVLKPDGVVLKVIPERYYLKELRERFYVDQAEKQDYSNDKVYEKFQAALTVVAEERLTYTYPLTSEQQTHALLMSPIQWGATADALTYAAAHPMTELTVDVRVLVGKFK